MKNWGKAGWHHRHPHLYSVEHSSITSAPSANFCYSFMTSYHHHNIMIICILRHRFPHSNPTDECLFILTKNAPIQWFWCSSCYTLVTMLFSFIGATLCCTFSAHPKCIICTFFVFTVLVHSAHFDPQSCSTLLIFSLYDDIEKLALLLRMSIPSSEHKTDNKCGQSRTITKRQNHRRMIICASPSVLHLLHRYRRKNNIGNNNNFFIMKQRNTATTSRNEDWFIEGKQLKTTSLFCSKTIKNNFSFFSFLLLKTTKTTSHSTPISAPKSAPTDYLYREKRTEACVKNRHVSTADNLKQHCRKMLQRYVTFEKRLLSSTCLQSGNF